MNNLIPIVIEPYPDELLYSWVMRLAKANELSNNIFLKTYLEKSNVIMCRLEVDIRKEYKSFYNALNPDIDMMDLYFQMSTTQFELAFTSTRQQIRVFNSIFRKESSFINVINYFIQKPKVCLECIKEDTTKYGEPYIHRSHQLSGVCACHKHHTSLYNLKYKSFHDYDFEDITDKVCDITDFDCKYAEYASKLLIKGLSSNSNDVLLVIKNKLDELSNIDNVPQNQTTNDIIRSLMKYNKTLLTQKTVNTLMWLFPNVDDFINKLPPYEMVVKKHCDVCNRDYYTTNQAILDGWGCTYCDDEMDKTKLLKRLVKKIGDDEFIFKNIVGDSKRQLLLCHKLTGNEFVAQLNSFLYENSKYHYTKTMTMKKVKQIMKQFEHFKLVSYSGVSKQAQIYHDVCGNTFDIAALYLFTKNPICRCCESKRSFDLNIFKQQVKDLVCDEYEVLECLGTGINGSNQVKIKHKTCGRVKAYAVSKFLTGERCPHCTSLITENCMKKMIEEYSNGRYKIISRNKYRIVLLDVKTNKEITLSPQLIVQEMTRPTPSPILEFDITQKRTQITSWDIWYELCIEYRKEFGHLYPKNGESYKGKSIYSWCQTQRQHYKQGKLSEEQIHKLQELDFVFDTDFYKWNQRFEEYKEFVNETGILFPGPDIRYNGNSVGSWVKTQKAQKKSGRLSVTREKLLLEVNPDFFKPLK